VKFNKTVYGNYEHPKDLNRESIIRNPTNLILKQLFDGFASSDKNDIPNAIMFAQYIPFATNVLQKDYGLDADWFAVKTKHSKAAKE
jgi:hypothetical protein